MKYIRILLWPLIMLKNILSANWWANKIWQKTNMEDKVQGSRFNRWQNSLPQPYRFIFKLLGIILFKFPIRPPPVICAMFFIFILFCNSRISLT